MGTTVRIVRFRLTKQGEAVADKVKRYTQATELLNCYSCFESTQLTQCVEHGLAVVLHDQPTKK